MLGNYYVVWEILTKIKVMYSFLMYIGMVFRKRSMRGRKGDGGDAANDL